MTHEERCGVVPHVVPEAHRERKGLSFVHGSFTDTCELQRLARGASWHSRDLSDLLSNVKAQARRDCDGAEGEIRKAVQKRLS
jgi:hypothetical protein